MCLAVPGKIVKIQKDKAIVDYGSEQREGKLLENSYQVGDYVIVQGGVAVMKIDEEEAKQALELYTTTNS